MQKLRLFIAAAVCLFGISGSVTPQSVCEIKQEQRAWIENVLGTWNGVSKHSLHLSSGTTPWLILFDETCVININPDGTLVRPESRIKLNRELMPVTTSAHDGQIQLPEGGRVPARLMSFAAPYNGGKNSFLVFALPSVWHQAPHLRDEKNVDLLARSVFVHEMTHTLHRNFYTRLDELEKKIPKGEQVDDDIIQNKFSKIDEYRAMFDKEMELLFQAAAASNRTIKKSLAKKAFDKIQARRSRFFIGENAAYAELESLFLTMEGVANWAAYQLPGKP